MDIEEPLSTLRKLLEARLQCSLIDHEFYLQDSIPVSWINYSECLTVCMNLMLGIMKI